MVGDAVLLEVVRPDLLGPTSASHLAAALLGLLRGETVLLQLEQPGPQHLQGAGPVLDLALFVLHGDDDAGGEVRDAHRRVRGVDRLSPRARRAEHVDPQVGRVDGHLHLVGLGKRHDGGGRGVDATLGLGDRYALHAVGPALVLHPRPGVGALDQEGDLVEAVALGGVQGQDLEAPPVPLRVTPVHLEQVPGEQVRLLASLGAADLHDDVAADVGVLGQQQEAELVLELGDLGRRLFDLGVDHVAVFARRLGQHLAGGRHVLLGLAEAPSHGEETFEILVASGCVAQAGLIAYDGRVAEVVEHRLVLPLPRVEAFPVHGTRVPTCPHPAAVSGDGLSRSGAGPSQGQLRLARGREAFCP